MQKSILSGTVRQQRLRSLAEVVHRPVEFRLRGRKHGRANSNEHWEIVFTSAIKPGNGVAEVYGRLCGAVSTAIQLSVDS